MRSVLVSLLVISCGKDAASPPAASDPAQIAVTRRAVKKLAFETYAEWSAVHVDKACPTSLADLGDAAATTDPWGKPFEIFCGPTLPAGVRGFGVVSVGPDGKAGTADDIRSWD
jgi:hypothetical protein